MSYHTGGPVELSPAGERDERIEEYLDRVDAPLIGSVPRGRRLELREELAAHLDALVEAHLELGATPDEAVSAALSQFGRPEPVGGEWLRVALPGRKRRAPLRGALVGALSGSLVGVASLSIFTAPLVLRGMLSSQAWLSAFELGMPMGAFFGAVIGGLRLSPRQAALVCGVMPAALYAAGISLWLARHPEQLPVGPITRVVLGSLMLLACGGAIGAAAAWTTKRFDRWGERLAGAWRQLVH